MHDVTTSLRGFRAYQSDDLGLDGDGSADNLVEDLVIAALDQLHLLLTHLPPYPKSQPPQPYISNPEP